METRKDRIRRLQSLIAAEEVLKAIFEKRGICGSARQAYLDNWKSQLDYEKRMELEEISRSEFIQLPNKSAVLQLPRRNWQDNVGNYIAVCIFIAVIAGLLIFLY